VPTIADIEEISKPNLNHIRVVLDELIYARGSLWYCGSDIMVCCRQIPIIIDFTNMEQQAGDTRTPNNLQHATNSGYQSQHMSVIDLWKMNAFPHLRV
jgi:hypothetical protein